MWNGSNLSAGGGGFLEAALLLDEDVPEGDPYEWREVRHDASGDRRPEKFDEGRTELVGRWIRLLDSAPVLLFFFLFFFFV